MTEVNIYTSWWSLLNWIKEPPFLAIYYTVPGIGVFMETDTTRRASQEKYTVMDTVLWKQRKITISKNKKKIKKINK